MIDDRGELTAYRSTKEKKIYVAHRGTKRLGDVGADASVLVGLEKYHPRFRRAEREVKRISRENPGYAIVSTGHSLGGSIAEATGKKRGEVVTFNKGAGVGALFQRRGKKQTDYTNVYDPVSMLSQFQRGGKLKQQRKVTVHPHTIKSATSKFV
jgi:hypothetical protein